MEFYIIYLLLLSSFVVGGVGIIYVYHLGFNRGYRHGHRLFQESSREPSGWVDDHDIKQYKAYVPGKKKPVEELL